MIRKLAKKTATLTCRKNDQFIADFEVAEAILSRNGADLIVDFDDGERLEIQKFFEKNSSIIHNKDVYTAVDIAMNIEAGNNQLPAMGPQKAPSQSHYHDWDDIALEKGIDHLDGLDYRTNREFQHETTEHHEGHVPENNSSSSSEPEIAVPVSSQHGASTAPDPVNINPQPVTHEPAQEPETPEFLTLPNIPVAEKGIASGISVPVTMPDGYEIIEIVTQGEKGILEKGPDGEWRYNLIEPDGHEKPGPDVKKDGDSVVIKVVDPEGNIIELTQKFDIIDDVPNASNDRKETMGGDPAGVAGSVPVDFGADNGEGKSFTVEGQDIAEPTTLVGKYGTLTINPDGSYSYIANPLGPDVDKAADIFNLAVIDADGDQVHGQIIIDILKPEPPVLEPLTVAEKGIETGESISITIPEGYTLVEISADPTRGELSGLDYVLTKPGQHPNQGEDILSGGDSATLILRDKWGNEYKVIQKINIIDDVPITGSDEQTTEAGDPAGVSGSIPVDFGADNGPDRSVTINGAKITTETQIRGEFGTLIMSEDGQYKYIADPLDADHDGAIDKFNVQVKDADGDIANGTITINITKPVVSLELSPITVEESGIETKTAAPFAIPDGYTLVGIQGSPEKGEVSGSNYILTKPAAHGEEDTLEGGDKVILILKDERGNEYAVEQKINIVDDVPEVGDDVQSVFSGQSVSGSVLVDFGADNGQGKSLSVNGQEINGELTITGQHGELTIKADGTYVYKANALTTDPAAPLVETFDLLIKDADGDIDPGAITISISKPVAPSLENILVKETGIEGSEKTPIKIPDGYILVRVETDPEKGEISNGEYQLKTPASHPGDGKDTLKDGDSATLVLKDRDGNEYRVIQKFDILDDIPEVGDDSQAVIAGQSVAGSVLVDFGADNGPGKSLSINGEEITGEKTISVAQGVLTIKADGTYTFSANPLSADKSTDAVKFDLQIRDADGDTDTGTITIAISKPAAPVLENLLVKEEGIESGETVQIKIPAGYELVRVETDPAKGAITDGKYELKSPAAHSGDGKDTLEDGDSAIIVLKDITGNEYRVTQKFDIVDDVPEVGDDAKSVQSGESVDGCVLVNFGADNGAGKSLTVDGKEITGKITIAGKYGELTINPDGTYEYAADPMTLDQPDTQTDTFDLLIKDADGDTDTGKITINIAKPDAPDLADLVVREAGIAKGESVDITLPEGYTLKETVKDPAHGEINGLAYTLKEALTHGAENAMRKGDSVVLVITDANGNEFRVTQNFTVIDDAPTATDDSAKISNTASSPISGNVLANDSEGADGISEKGVVWGSQQPKYGSITLNSDGAWSYNIDASNPDVAGLQNGQSLTEVFHYSFTDKDGDEAHATLTITIDGNSIPERPVYLDIEDEHLVVSEHDMMHGGSIAPIAIVDKNGKEYTVAEVLEDGFFGHVEKSGDSWGYVLDRRTNHKGEGADTKENADLVRLRVVDEEGNSFIVVRKVDIIDDLPELELSRNDLGVVVSGTESDAGILTFDFGADNTDGRKIIVSVNGAEAELALGQENAIAGKFGQLIISADGSYVYRAFENADQEGRDVFSFTIVDSDGDAVSEDAAGRAFDVVANVIPAREPVEGSEILNERDLRDCGRASVALTVDGFEIVGIVDDGKLGHIENVNGQWVYVLDGRIAHAGEGADTKVDADAVVLKVVDKAGNVYDAPVKISVIDDVPSMEVAGGGTVPAGESITGTIDFEFGADGLGNVFISFEGKETEWHPGVEIAGKYGTLIINDDGTWTYTANTDNRFGHDSFQLRIVDADGDSVDSETGAGVLIGSKKPFEIDVNVLPDNVDIDPSIIYEQDLAFGDLRLDIAVDGWTITAAQAMGHAGTMQNVNGQLQYVLGHSLDHENAVNIVDSVRLTLRNDETGNVVTLDKRIDIVDDKPRLSIEPADIPIADGIVVNERDLRDGGRALANLEGDGYEILGVARDGQFGSVKYEDGHWVYELNGAFKHGNSNYPKTAKNADYVTLKVRDENGFNRKVEVAVDIVDDRPDRDIYLNAELMPGGTWSYTFDKAEFLALMGADGTDWEKGADLPTGVWESDIKNGLKIRDNGSSVTISASLPDPLTYSNEFIYDPYYYIDDADGNQLKIKVHFNRIPYDVTPEIIEGTSGNDIINPNPKFHYTGNKDTNDSYWTADSRENIIYGREGDDVIMGEGLYIAADETYEQAAAARLNHNQYAEYYPDLIYGGSGNDTIYLSGAGGVIFGDGTDNPDDSPYLKFLEAIGLDCKFYDLYWELANLPIERLQKIAEIVENFESESDGNDFIQGAGHSVIFGNGGNDIIKGNTKIILFGGSGNDEINTCLYGFGGAGDDWIQSSQYAFGGAGDDVIHCSPAYSVFGEDGNDIFWISTAISISYSKILMTISRMFIPSMRVFRGNIQFGNTCFAP